MQILWVFLNRYIKIFKYTYITLVRISVQRNKNTSKSGVIVILGYKYDPEMSGKRENLG